MKPPFSVATAHSLLIAQFQTPQKMLSWSINRPGFQVASCVVWIEVRNADLPSGFEPEVLVADRLAEIDRHDAIAMITSRTVAQHHFGRTKVEGVGAACLATVGLSNGERIGERQANPPPLGTINLLLHIDTPVTSGALIELVSIAAMARTTAILDSGVRRNGVAITGTGTDCIVVAAPDRGVPAPYAGMHTAIGEAAGSAVYQAVMDGVKTWRSDFEALLMPDKIQG